MNRMYFAWIMVRAFSPHPIGSIDLSWPLSVHDVDELERVELLHHDREIELAVEYTECVDGERVCGGLAVDAASLPDEAAKALRTAHAHITERRTERAAIDEVSEDLRERYRTRDPERVEAIEDAEST